MLSRIAARRDAIKAMRALCYCAQSANTVFLYHGAIASLLGQMRRYSAPPGNCLCRQRAWRQFVRSYRPDGDGVFEKRITHHKPRTYRLICRCVGNATDAYDVLQDTFYAVWRAAETVVAVRRRGGAAARRFEGRKNE